MLYREIVFLDAFLKFRKATINFDVSVRMEQLGSNWTDFRRIWYLRFFRQSIGKIQVLLKSDKNNGYVTWKLGTFMIVLSSILLSMTSV